MVEWLRSRFLDAERRRAVATTPREIGYEEGRAGTYAAVLLCLTDPEIFAACLAETRTG